MPNSSRAWRVRGKVLRRLAHQCHTCPWCGHYLSQADANAEHIVPKTLGGTYVWENLAAAHIWCNNDRGNDMSIDPVAGRQFQFIRDALTDYRARLVNPEEATDPIGVLAALERWHAELRLTTTVESILRDAR